MIKTDEGDVDSRGLSMAVLSIRAAHRSIKEVCTTPNRIAIHAYAMKSAIEILCEELEKVVPAEVLEKQKIVFIGELELAYNVLQAEDGLAN